ncbi:MAG: hypothetical protein AAFZ11_10090 [Pseudomonadota bacterium]
MNWRAILAGWLAFGLTNLLLVFALFRRFSNIPPPASAPVHPLIGFTVYVTLMVALFAWVAERMASPWRAALALGGAQFLLVNVDMVLRGDRAIETALASTLMMAITWGALALAWQLTARR